MGYVTLLGEYYEGDRRSPDDQSIPQRPDVNSHWNGSEWIVERLPDWKGLELAFTNNPLFGKAFAFSPPKALSLLLTTISSTHNQQTLFFSVAQMRAGMPEDFNVAEIAEMNRILGVHNFDVVIPEKRDTKTLSFSTTLDANIRNSNEPQIVTGRVPLRIDNLKEGSFNHMPWEVWNPKESRIVPSHKEEIYLARLSLVPSSATSSVITVELDVNGVAIYRKNLQPMTSNELIVDTWPFFASQTLYEHGGILYVSASVETELRNVSLYLVRLSTAL